MAQAQDTNPMLQPPLPPVQLEKNVPAEAAPAPYVVPAAPWQQPQPIQVTEGTFLAARLREALAEVANLRQVVAELQVENSKLRARQTQVEIAKLDEAYQVGQGTTLVGKEDGTYWRLPKQQASAQS